MSAIAGKKWNKRMSQQTMSFYCPLQDNYPFFPICSSGYLQIGITNSNSGFLSSLYRIAKNLTRNSEIKLNVI